MDRTALRIADANFNRAKEALRVGEEIARFYFDDKKLTAEYKNCRHQLGKLMPVAYLKLVGARDSAKDVGKKSWIQDAKRPGWKDLLVANHKRAQEAVRVLEELAKVFFPESAPKFQALRFRLYELERKSLQKF